MTDFSLPFPIAHRAIARPEWLVRIRRLLRARGRLARRHRLRDVTRSRAHDWMLALPQSRHGG